MATVLKPQWVKVCRLYRSGLSMALVAKELNVSIGAVVYVLRKSHIPRRSPSEANEIRFKSKPLSFTRRTQLTARQSAIKLAGVLLYWAEGHKSATSKSIDFANSDPAMVKIFLSFLREICGVDESRLRVYLYCHEASMTNRLIEYWSSITGISRSQFTKPYIAKHNSGKSSRMPNGMIHIRYSDKKLLQLVMSWIKEFQSKYCVGGRVVNCI